MLHRIRSKNRWMKVSLFTSSLQGKNCSKEIVENINKINKLNNIDLILIGRGGGSRDDLMEYDDEKLVETIYHSDIPIITAIGHQKDKSLADMVADKSYITPTEASDNITTDTNVLIEKLEELKIKMKEVIKHNILLLKNKFIKKHKFYNIYLLNQLENIKDKIRNKIYNRVNNYQNKLIKKKLIFNYTHLLGDITIYKLKLREIVLKKITDYTNLFTKRLINNESYSQNNKILIASDKEILTTEEHIISSINENKYIYLYLNNNKKIKIFIKDFSIENLS